MNGYHQVNCDKAEWEEIIKGDDPNAGNIRNKSWPLLDGGNEVFGKDRANGDGVGDVMDTLNEFLNEVDEEGPTNDDHTSHQAEEVNNKFPQPNEHDDPSVCNSSKYAAGTSGTKSKRKRNSESTNMAEVLVQIQRDMNARSDSLIIRIGHHIDIAHMRKEVYNLIKLIPDLSLTESFTACDKIIGKVERLEFFMGLPASDHAACVAYVLTCED